MAYIVNVSAIMAYIQMPRSGSSVYIKIPHSINNALYQNAMCQLQCPISECQVPTVIPYIKMLHSNENAVYQNSTCQQLCPISECHVPTKMPCIKMPRAISSALSKCHILVIMMYIKIPRKELSAPL